MLTFDRPTVARTIDATLLDPDASDDDVRHVCAAALMYQVRGVCVRVPHVSVAAAEVAGSGLEIAGVAGFPGGDDPIASKVDEIAAIAASGGYEVDVVMQYRALADGDRRRAADDANAVVAAAHGADLACKIIVEAGALTDEQLATACELAVEAGADWVKTSTGYGPPGATPDIVRRVRGLVPDEVQVKAAGGIRTWDQAVALIEAGAAALGCSGFVALLEQAPRTRTHPGRDGRT